MNENENVGGSCWCSGYHTGPAIPETWVRFPAASDQFLQHYFEFILLSTNSNILLTTACIVQSCDSVKPNSPYGIYQQSVEKTIVWLKQFLMQYMSSWRYLNFHQQLSVSAYEMSGIFQKYFSCITRRRSLPSLPYNVLERDENSLESHYKQPEGMLLRVAYLNFTMLY